MYFAYGREVNFCWPGDGLWQVGISKDGHTPHQEMESNSLLLHVSWLL